MVWTTLTIPCHMKCSLMRCVVLVLLRWPEVESTWQAWRIFNCSSLLWTNRRSTSSYVNKGTHCNPQKIQGVHGNVYYSLRSYMYEGGPTCTNLSLSLEESSPSFTRDFFAFSESIFFCLWCACFWVPIIYRQISLSYKYTNLNSRDISVHVYSGSYMSFVLRIVVGL